MTRTRFVLFADAGSRVGSGHWVRSAALWRRLLAVGCDALMLVPKAADWEPPENLPPIRTVEDDARAIVRAIKEHRPEATILDTYRNRDALLEMLGRSTCAIFDDHASSTGAESVIINPTLGADRTLYPPDATARILAGPGYLPMDDAFADVRERYRVRSECRRLVVALGGTDAAGRLNPLMSALHQAVPVESEVHVVGPRVEADSPRVQSHGWLSPAKLAELMGACDLAILAGGTMIYQAACIGIPAIAWPQSAAQTRHLDAWIAARALSSMIRLEELPERLSALWDKPMRRELSDAARPIVDGRGAGRVERILREVP